MTFLKSIVYVKLGTFEIRHKKSSDEAYIYDVSCDQNVYENIFLEL